ncbi:MAG TPA: sigma-70 family RNA polymerase sigma factor [Candidatus Dormibacteraeota bacterium]|nr:sigma-70 family RNA polymerase sigma factor [Candidatus Dormibacteraeota bacterium]
MSAASRATPVRDFDSIVGPHVEAGYRLAVTMLLDPDEARDAVQDAAVKAWRSLDRLHDTASARAWFLSIVANRCRSTMRRRWWRLGRNELVERAHVDSPEAGIVRAVDIAAGMRALSPEDRAILQLRFYFDLRLEEVAKILGISVGAARSRVYRAAARLGTQLTEEDLS